MKYKESEKVNVGLVKEHFSAYVAKAEKGQPTIVCRRNRPVAELVPVQFTSSSNGTRLSSARGSVVVECDLLEPAMDETDWNMLGR